MPMLLIKGLYEVKGSQPDGDTVAFTPDAPAEWDLVGGGRGRAVEHSATGRAKLRLDAIDALETHYGANRVHQPLRFAHAARDELLSWIGFTEVQREGENVIATTPDAVPGFVLTRGTDVHGRCIALAGRGAPPGDSGREIDVDPAVLRTTLNHHLLTVGLTYPTFYRSLFTSLRAEMAITAEQARTAGRGLWPTDVTLSGVKVSGLSSLTDDAVLLPKLFRRLVDYLNLGTLPLTCFPAFLAGVGDRFSILSTGERCVGLHRVVETTNGETVRMTHPPEDLLFEDS
ncbi:nuclease [Streptomyces sp. NPDC005496]|uniref:nuclease n=1 Tax=unclassified Streptomyces TaxID=2593676 RepID=UPI0033A80D20